MDRKPVAPVAAAALLCLTLVLAVGCELASEPSAPPTPSATATASPTATVATPSPEPTFLIYLVRPNDALAKIAKRFRTTVDSIGYWNRARYASLDPDSSAYRPDAIAVGWLLRIHPGQTTDGDDGSATEEPGASGSPEGSPAGSPDEASASPSG